MCDRDDVRKINRYSNIARWVRSCDQAAVLSNELPQGKNEFAERLAVECESLQTNRRLAILDHMVDHRIDVAAMDLDMSGGLEARIKQRMNRPAIKRGLRLSLAHPIGIKIRKGESDEMP